MKISEKKDEQLLSRTKVKGVVGFESHTPSRLDLRKHVASALKVPESNVAVSKIRTSFGEKKAVFEANIYNSVDDLNKFESIVVLRRLGLKPKKAKAAKEAKPAKK